MTSDRTLSALTHPYADLDDDASDQFVLGRSFFHIPWVEAPAATTARDGLGPLFNANSCVSCHRNNGGGNAIHKNGSLDRSIIVKLSQSSNSKNNKTKVAFEPDPIYGIQLSINGNNDVPFEGRVQATLLETQVNYQDGYSVSLFKPEVKLTDLNYGLLSENTRIDVLRAPVLIGLGLIEQIPEKQILQYQDEKDQDGDGISGRANQVWSVQYQQFKTGRYGWKATSASVIEQTAKALIDDMSLTTAWHKDENCTASQQACKAAYRSQGPDVPMRRLRAINDYLTHLRKPREEQNIDAEGKKLFQSLGCQGCHRNGYQTEQGVIVNPYSDFLLHDMGSALSGSSTMFGAAPEEWRTPPLWGLGLTKTLNPDAGYLHDGRASTLEQAVMWHGGEAKSSQQAFAALPKRKRDILLAFLHAL